MNCSSEVKAFMDVKLGAYAELLGKYLRPQRRRVALLAILILSGIGIQLLNPQFIRYFIDTAQGAGTLEALLFAAALFLGSALVLQILQVWTTYVGEDVGWRATNDLRADLLSHCMQLDMSFHHERTPGEMIERIDGDVVNLAVFFAQFVIRVLGSLLLLIGILTVLLWEDWRISLALLIYSIVSIACLLLARNIAIPHWKATRVVSADLFGYIEEQLAGTEDIRSSGATAYVLRKLLGFNRVRVQKEARAALVSAMMISIWFVLLTLGLILAFVASYLLYTRNLISLGTVYLVIFYTNMLFDPLRNLTEQIEHFQKAAASVQRLQELTHIHPSLLSGKRGLPEGAFAVAFRSLDFSYHTVPSDALEAQPNEVEQAEELDRSFALRDISFSLGPGQVMGLLGRTGSGKTTITKLLFRLYDPQIGAIELGDRAGEWLDLRTLELTDLRQRVGIVTQEVQLFRASVRDNLTFFAQRSISDERIFEVLEDLGLGSWLSSLPHGLDSELSSEGAGLSAGEAQLLAFARVFLKDPGLVILDEASSRLDPATERLIEHAVDRLIQGRTCIIIAHRLHTVHRADQILILESGQVAEQGVYKDLVADPHSRFAQLLRTGLEEVLV